MFVDDCADACIFLMKNYSANMHINVGSGEDITIYDVARLVCNVVGFTGEIERDITKPDGTPRKLMSAEKLRAMGWAPKVDLSTGVAATYEWFLANKL